MRLANMNLLVCCKYFLARVHARNWTFADDNPDFRETAPGAAHENMFTHDPISSIRGGLASGVPGDVKGLEYLHQKYGVSSTELFCHGRI